MQQSSNSSDNDTCNQIIASCLRGDQNGYAELYDRFAAGIYRLCYSLLLNEQDAEDILQDSFVYAFRNLDKFDPQKASFKTWLYTIAVSRCRNTFRRKVVPTVDMTSISELKESSKVETPEAAVTRRDVEDTILDALSSLPTPLRTAIILRYGHHLTYREIAEVMDCPQKTAESRVRLAHERLRRLLQSDGEGLLQALLSVS